MSGGGGGIIIRQSAVTVLTNPTVHGLLPAHMTAAVDPILAAPEAGWTTEEKMVVAHVYSWAVVHL